MENLTPERILEVAVRAADGKKGKEIMAMAVANQTTLADYFVVMTGSSTPHIRALSGEIEKKLKDDYGLMAHHIEGVTSNWILMDYSSVVINIFLSEARELYALERLWQDAESVDIEKYLSKE